MLPYKAEIFSEHEWSGLVEDMSFSLREGQIVQCLFIGQSDKQIADKLQIGIPTVRTHLERLFRKLNVNDHQELILNIFCHFRNGCRKLGCPRQQ
ncbi:MAG: helix-turn-helix transcriptional regulator [Planctomycetota bacterium]|nr:helix-turn-helix transcriptional regulator [Planctomycetota bacterium]